MASLVQSRVVELSRRCTGDGFDSKLVVDDD